MKSTFALGEDVNIKFNAENYFPVVKYAGIELSMMTENNTKLVFTDKKENIIIPACNGNVPVSWSFRPETPGHYSALVNATGGLDFGRTEVFYSEPSIGSGFDVRQNTSSVVVEKGPYVSPLKQFKSGIIINDVKCDNGFSLVIKVEDGSSACVKPQTSQILKDRNWGYPVGKDIVLDKPSDITKSSYKLDPQKEKMVREKQKILEDALIAEQNKHGGFQNRTHNLPWSAIGYDYVDHALEVSILPDFFNTDNLPKYFEKIRNIVGHEIDIALSPMAYANLT